MREQRYIPWEWLVAAAAGVMIVTMGARQSLGLFLAPIDQSTGLGIATISFAMAIAQFVWGAAQPIAGAIADRYGPDRVIIGGLLLLSLGTALTPFLGTGVGLIFTIGLLQAAGTGAASFSVLVGATMRRLPVYSRGMAAGVINAGGSFGQFLFAPILQRLIVGFGWPVAMWCMAVAALAITPAARVLRRPAEPSQQRLSAADSAPASNRPWAIVAIYCCTPASLRVASISRFWSRTCRVKSICADCPRASPVVRWRSLASPISLEACSRVGAWDGTEANTFCLECTPRARC